MTDPRDALLAEAARLLTIVDNGGTYERRHVFTVYDDAKIRAWLARYEAERAGRRTKLTTFEDRDRPAAEHYAKERAIAEAEQRGAERERVACEKIAREHMQIRDGGITAAEGEGREEDAMLEASAFAAAEYIADAIAARTAPATPGKEET